MPMPYPLKIWQLARDVAAKGPLADPRRYGLIPHELKPLRRTLPTLLHGKRITFGDNISPKGSNRTRRAYLPNIIYHPLYSRALDMNVWCRLSAHALREVDAAGGFDEYLCAVQEKYVQDCDVAKMYQRKVREALAKGRAQRQREEMRDLVGGKYGDAYVEQLDKALGQWDAQVRKRREKTA
ncbi:hypothetical protein HKX48_002897 [Thoreauomyces humboldtii]|nr:hypothetical protein HKX48_002897 [Thoreauomyces humboldtii]